MLKKDNLFHCGYTKCLIIESHLKFVLDTVPIAAIIFDAESNFIDCNEEALRLFLLTTSEEFGEYFQFLMPPYQPDNVLSIEFFNDMLHSSGMHGNIKQEFTYQRMDGTLLPTETTFANFSQTDNAYIICYIRDVSARRKALDQMKNALITSKLMLNAIPIACFLITRDFVVIECNQEAIDLFGFANKKDAMENYLKIFPGKPSSIFLETILKENDTAKFEYTLLDTKSNTIDCQIFLVPINYHGEMVLGVYHQDLREIKEVQEKAKFLDVAQSENLAKNQFLARMSHEIRTPVNVICGVADIQLKKTYHPPDTEEAFLQIHKSGTFLTAIIDDLLDLSKVVAGKLEIIESPYETASLIMDTVQFNLQHKGSKKVKFILEVDENLPVSLVGDVLRLKQILNNLLSNAFKYTNEGQIVLDISKMPSVSSGMQLCISVSDTGRGMTKSQVDTLFDEYTRFNLEESRYIQGVGLGLHITQQLIHLMNGKVTVDSEEGVGSQFTVHIPQQLADSRALGKQVAENLRNYEFSQFDLHKKDGFEFEPMPYGRVLVVDDQESNLYVARGIISSYHIRVETVTSGQAALNKVIAGEVYDIIFMDHMMPDMDGLEAAKRIKRLGYSHPIVALTANTILGQSEMFLSNGFAGFISKPIDLKALNSCLIRLIRNKQKQETIDAARLEFKDKDSRVPENNLSDGIIQAFLRDCERTLRDIEKFLNEPWTPEAIENYTTTVHGIKGSLANIGEKALSEAAKILEFAGSHSNLDVIRENTSDFVENLTIKMQILQKQAQKSDGEGKETETEGDIAFLIDQLLIIKNAAETYNKKNIKSAVDEINKSVWSNETRAMLDEIASMLLHSEFDEIAEHTETMLNSSTLALQLEKANS
ncbi:MAG: ATP-binding protein [Turicibacter sp.]|nr:ATP-binding protein [Turicibacter sp.]